jgi:hypothetical protein
LIAAGLCQYTYTLDANSFITMNSSGQAFFGPNWTGTYPPNAPVGTTTQKSDRIYLTQSVGTKDPITSYLTIVPNNQIVNLDSEFYKQNTINKPTEYSAYITTETTNPDDGRTPTAGYDPRGNVVEVQTTTGLGAQECIESEIATLAGLPKALNYCIGAQQVGLNSQAIDVNGLPTENCSPGISLFCVEKPNKTVNNSAPVAKQYGK